VTNNSENLAQELHDGIAQDLVALGFSIDSILSLDLDADTRAQLRELRFQLTTLVDKVRQEIHQLRKSGAPLPAMGESSRNFELQRIFQEILRNIEEHSQATLIKIEISDNGVGGVQEKVGAFGITGIHERMNKLNGDIHIDSSEKGTKISLAIPLDG
jgi:signal transduction histidine kinase